ncbi:LysR family transcriptional regulator [Acetobacter musti]|uniref:LysR family transcriptional regulator n=1 Tax=Acetobacter musti TaxID=864732 RepID=UPI001F553E3B|nr:LysR family transcriptional regulator [Acetobacter musti]
MHSRVLAYLDTVARCGSIRKAGEQLNVASTAINRQILALEAELGTPLFERLPRKLVLTAAGEILLAHVRETLRGMSHTRKLIDEVRGLHRGEIVVAGMDGPVTALLPDALTDLRKTHRNVRVHLMGLGQPELVRTVQDGEADIGVGFDLPGEAGLRVICSRSVTLGAVVSATHPLACQESVSVHECEAWPLVVADETMAIRPHLEEFYNRQNLAFSPAMETNSIEFMRQMAMRGEAITYLTPLDIIREQRERMLKFLPFRDAELQPQRFSVIAHARNTNPLLPFLVERIEALLPETA